MIAQYTRAHQRAGRVAINAAARIELELQRMLEINTVFLDSTIVLTTLLGFILLLLLVLEIFNCPRRPMQDFLKLHPFFQRKYFNKLIYGYSSHNGPATWKLCFPECTGENQSPINIDTRDCLVVNPSSVLKMENWDTTPINLYLQNNGHTVILMGEWNSNCYPTITGGPLGDAVFKFNCVSFRWGPNDDEGSEHTIDNNRFSLEVQVSNTRATVEGNGCFKDNNIAIVSFLYNVTNGDNPYLDCIVENLHKIKDSSTPWPIGIPSFPLKWLMRVSTSSYYAYSGSLTHPPCSEGVTWIVFPEVLSISAKQVECFRKLHSRDGERILINTRPVQLLNSRSAFYYD